MVLDIAWPWSKGKEKKGHKTVSVYLGFFFVLNYCLGTGFLGIPYSFFYSGYLAAIPTLLFISVVSLINANYLLEAMARAQALEYLKDLHDLNPATDSSDTTDSDLDTGKPTSQSLLKTTLTRQRPPKFEITVRRKFEISEMCEIFVSRYLKYAYLVLLSIFSFLICWTFSTVAASAWASNIPFNNFGMAEQCAEDAFTSTILPSDRGCLYAYYFSLVMYGVIVITLSLFELKEQVVIQMTLGLMRFAAVAAIIVYCVVRLAQGGDACLDAMEASNSSTATSISGVIMKFDIDGWLVAVPVISFAFLFHTGISSLTHPIKQKHHLSWLLVVMFAVSTACYLSLGVVVPLWFRASIQETCTLNWALFTRADNSLFIRILSYCLILFPSFDVVSVFPLLNHVVVNNLYILITGHDTSMKAKYRFDWFLRISLRVVVGILPILAAFGVANLIYILKYGGLAGFVCYFFPFVLQLSSIRMCKRKFSTLHISMSGGTHTKNQNGGSRSVEDKGKIFPGLGKNKSLLLAKDLDSKEKQSLYMTPYSIRFLSHPVCVWIVGGIGLVLFVLTLTSLFVHPNQLTC